ncbi:TetR/AcrR family transcriptional regulator [Desulfatibacillum aliphaticivorans]|nr:TetR/AcrR family transcriptional regulator [Desulfatibacillum aliphaticivorans]
MKPEERKKLILASAKKLFSRNGYYQTQISDIIKDAGIARGTIYQYFANKEDVFVTLAEEYYSLWEESISLAAADLDLDMVNPVNYFRHRIKRTLFFFSQDKDLCNIALRVGLGLPGEMASVIKRFEERIIRLLIGDLKLGIDNGHVRQDLNVELTANLLTGALLSTAYHFYSRDAGKAKPLDINKTTEEITAVFAPGIFVKPYQPKGESRIRLL